MKKYITAVVAFVLIAAASHAQATPKKATDNTVAKMSKPAVKKSMASVTTAAVSPTPSAPAKKASTEATIGKKKHHKKSKSVKPVSK